VCVEEEGGCLVLALHLREEDVCVFACVYTVKYRSLHEQL